ncbi:triose-phosphate isomerase [Marichromatium bheemlicum]|uniref:Triosephosphate isomerase n=1 Tax=Marichromatium bheemlicum TaxID=365339 RepID=A0ABX1I3I6_9GAMM|nr:triose-phosphate isomerase [Marichromatium bheemlicum]NKN32030.1 triose-phosphate isomerase [Marichromatium bheemlicum]
MRAPLIAGNWKMNGSKRDARALLGGVAAGAASLQGAEVAVCPPFPYLALGEAELADSVVCLGAQDVSTESAGAYTGEVAAAMLAEFGCRYVICGHSERRDYHAESDTLIARKLQAVIANGMRPILCVGETLEQRERGETEAVIGAQLDGVLGVVGIETFADLELAYEPVWAIGTGKTATPAQAQQVHAFVRAKLGVSDRRIAQGVRILYGGSMKPGNAAELLAQPDIDGGLIGGASLDVDDFLAICRAAEAAAG